MDFDQDIMNSSAGFTPEYRKAYIWSLVLHAAGIDHLMMRQENVWHLLVHETIAESAKLEIAAYEEENRNWPPPQEEPQDHILSDQSSPPTVALMGGLLLFFQVTGPWSQSSKWFQVGAVNAARILENHEWWRIVTGLTLHADIVHVVGNVLFGGILIHYICKIFGSGSGVALVLATGVAGNFINVLMRGGDHRAVGFSTAVFGAVGLLSGFRVKKGSYQKIIMPLGAGLGLLAMLGSEGERTDLGAHFWGLATGVVTGLFFARKIEWLKTLVTFGRQSLLLAGSVIFILTSWFVAMY